MKIQKACLSLNIQNVEELNFQTYLWGLKSFNWLLWKWLWALDTPNPTTPLHMVCVSSLTWPAQQFTRFWNSQLVYQVCSDMWVPHMFLISFSWACRFAISSDHHIDLENITGIHFDPASRRAWEYAVLDSLVGQAQDISTKILKIS